jgi:hypothetical protein
LIDIDVANNKVRTMTKPKKNDRRRSIAKNETRHNNITARRSRVRN